MDKIGLFGILCLALSLVSSTFMLGFNYGKSVFKRIDNTINYETDYVKSIEIDTLYKNIKDSTYVFNIKKIE